jgi:DHA1 family multidrug resistance protein-like MFS transporter
MGDKKRLIFLGLWGATLMVQFGETIPQSFQPLFFEQLGISAALIGILYNIRNVEQMGLSFFSGSLSDVLGRKKLILIGLILIALVPLIYAVSWNTWFPIAGMFVSGLGLSIFFPPTQSYASSLYPPHQVGAAMGRYHMSWAVSAVIGPSVGGFLALYFPEYRQIFVIASITSMTAVAIFTLLTRGDHESRSGENVSNQTSKLIQEFPSTMRRLSSNKAVVAGCAAVFVHAFCHWMLPTYIPLYAEGVLGFNTVDIGLALTANALVMAVALPIVGTFSDRTERLPLIVTGLLVSVAAFAVLPEVRSPIALIALMAVLGFCAVLEFPISQAVVMESIPLVDRGSATGVWAMMMSLGGTIGMFIMAFIVSVAPIGWIFYFCAAFSLAAGLGMVVIRGYFKTHPGSS